MKRFASTGLVILTVLIALQPACDEDPPLLEETVSQPYAPSGDNTCLPGDTIILATGGAASSLGHRLQYRFDLDEAGAHDFTDWSYADSAAASWPDTGLYAVVAQARCSEHTSVLSPRSEITTVAVGTELVATPPEIFFTTFIGGVFTAYDPAATLDTVGVMQPFSISYRGVSHFGGIAAYKYFPLTAGVTIPGQDIWIEDIADTLRQFPNTGDGMLPSGVFDFAAQCRDEIGAVSVVDTETYSKGVCRVLVNFDPDTRINRVVSLYTVDSAVREREINFSDGEPDTVSDGSWLRLEYQGWDDPRDGRICPPDDPGDCIGFQTRLCVGSRVVPGAQECSVWMPSDGVHDSDPFSAADSSTFFMSSSDYELFVRAVDEHGRPDGTPPSVEIVGNFVPVMDSLVVEDHLGNRIDPSVTDEMTWNFWKGEGWPYQCECDTVARARAFCDADVTCMGRPFPDSDGSLDFYKSWSVRIRAWGHDHPMDPQPSGVKSWRYMIQNSRGEFLDLGKGLAGRFDGAEINVLDDSSIRWLVYYPGPFTANPDPNGDTVFDNPPGWLNDDLTLYVAGNDASTVSRQSEQSIFLSGRENIIDTFAASTVGRWTEERVVTFRIRLVR
jgi:hypothetical protein